jgi:hypothetical protein
MKCLVKGCTETTTEGDWLCPRCFVMISTAVIDDGHTFIHDLRDELLIAARMAESLSVIAALAIDGEGLDQPRYTEPAKYGL